MGHDTTRCITMRHWLPWPLADALAASMTRYVDHGCVQKYFLIEKKPWYNKYLQTYETILTINDIPDDLSKHIKRDANVKISDFSTNSNLCSNCFNYFVKQLFVLYCPLDPC